MDPGKTKSFRRGMGGGVPGHRVFRLVQIEKIQLLNFDKIIYEKNFLKNGMVLRVIWQGAEYRGRGREVDWNGKVFISNNNFSNLVTKTCLIVTKSSD